MPSSPSNGLSFPRLAWRQLQRERVSAAGGAFALLLVLLPAWLLVVESSGARADLRHALSAAGGLVVERTGTTSTTSFDAFQQQARAQVGPLLGPYVDGGSGRVTAGPFRVDSIDSSTPGPPADAAAVAVTYVADLASRVDVAQGLLTSPQHQEQTVSMSMPAADRFGIRLFDTICVHSAAGQGVGAQPWCARVSGIWRPTAGSDPQLTAGGLQLFTDHDAFFGLMGQQPPDGATTSRLYRPDPAAIAPQDAGTVADRVRELRTAVAAVRAGAVRSALDTDLDRVSAARASNSFPVWVLAAALVPLSALLAGVLASWYVESRRHELALLRARGWSEARVQRLVLAQFAALGAAAVCVALLGLLVLALVDGILSLGPGQVAPGLADVPGVAVAVGVPAVAAAAWCVRLARWASRQNVLRLEHPEAVPPLVLAWGSADRIGLLVLPAAFLLLVPRVVGPGRAPLAALVLNIAGLLMLMVAALPALSSAAEAPSRSRTDVEGTLARWQLHRWWQRHAAAGLLLVLALALASFAAAVLAYHALGARDLGSGVAVGLTVGFAGTLATALLAYGLVFRFACQSRADEYTALVVDGLPTAAVRHSLRIEQHTVLIVGVLVGLGLGLVLVWVTSPDIGLAGEAGVTAGVFSALLAVAGGLAVARLVRTGAVVFRMVEEARQAT